MRFIQEEKLSFDSVALVPKRSEVNSRADVILEREFTTKHSKQKLSGIPICASNVFATGSFAVSRVMSKHEMYTALCKHHSLEDINKFYEENPYLRLRKNFFTIGSTKESERKLLDFQYHWQNSFDKWAYDPMILIDVANAYTSKTLDFVKYVRDFSPTNVLMVGNVCTPEMTTELILAGADIVKVGIAQSQICTTKSITGITYGQFSATVECSDAAHALGGLICVDGSLKTPGDICKAFGAGADFCMGASIFSGVDENDGEWITKTRQPNFEEFIEILQKLEQNRNICLKDNQYKHSLLRDYQNIYPYADDKYYIHEKQSLKLFGMSSKEAQEKFGGWEKEYRAAEGICVEVPYKGPLEDTLRQIEGGIRSCCAYAGAKRLKDMSKVASFVRIN